MDLLLSNLTFGFKVALEPINLLYCFVGVTFGTLIGVLPGIGPPGAIALLLPFTFGLPAVTGIITLGGIYYGAMYGGSTTSILVNIPGEAASVVTCIDGHQMALKGRAGPALSISAIGSLLGGTVGIVLLMFLCLPLAGWALKFGPPEYVGLMVLGLSLVSYLSEGTTLKAWIMAIVGVILGTFGPDPQGGKLRFTFGITDLSDGVELVAMAMGYFGISEVLVSMETPIKKMLLEAKIKMRDLYPTLKDFRKSFAPMLRGTLLGFCLGCLPGGGPVISSFASYAVEKKVSKHPEEFGKGAIEGVAGPETANNAATSGCFVPLLALGIPSNVNMALILGALIVHGISPGPLLISEHPEIFWGTVASMYIGNIMLVILNLPLVGIWVKILKIPDRILFPLIILFCLIGVYTVNNKAFDVLVMLIFGVMAYVLRRYGYDGGPLILAFCLGPMLESAFYQSMILSNGELSIFYTRPISAIVLSISFALIMLSVIRSLFKIRKA